MARARRRIVDRAGLTPGEAWVGFLRGYGPVNRIDGMFAETIQSLADDYGVPPLRFEHPRLEAITRRLNPAAGVMTNVVLTGTAGDGKTSLCNELWSRLGGDDRRATGISRDDHLPLEVEVGARPVTVHFIFEFSGFAPPKDEPWPEDKLQLLDRFVASVLDGDRDEYFVIAANDGKLVQAWDGLPENRPAARLKSVIEDLLATDREGEEGTDLLFLNLSRMATVGIMREALACLLSRPEWRCFEEEAAHPAFGERSPLRLNHAILSELAFQERLLALADLCDCNGLHVSIREVLLLLVNALLGHAKSEEHVLRPDGISALVASGREREAAIYGNLFGWNLPPNRRDQYAVFRHFGTFRLGQETTNLFDSIIIFGADDEDFAADHRRHLGSDQRYGVDAHFEALRRSYLDADDDRAEPRQFVDALADERRRLFFRLPEGDQRLDPWRLTVFHAAQDYRTKVLAPLRLGRPIELAILQKLVCGLNRIWTGMLVGEIDRLCLSTGLDFSSAPVSEISLYDVPIAPGFNGDLIEVHCRDGDVPVLRVSFATTERGAGFPLHLMRYEFLMRVAGGALPNSFSKECNEDVMAFKSQLLSEFLALLAEKGLPAPALAVLVPQPGNGLGRKLLSLPL